MLVDSNNTYFLIFLSKVDMLKYYSHILDVGGMYDTEVKPMIFGVCSKPEEWIAVNQENSKIFERSIKIEDVEISQHIIAIDKGGLS